MKNNILLLLMFAILSLGSCTVMGTLYPLAENEKDLVTKKELIGRWTDIKDNSQVLIIDSVAGENDKAYRLTLIERATNGRSYADTSFFIFNIVLIGGNYFIDSHIDNVSMFSGETRDYTDLMVPRHFIYQIIFTSSSEIALSFPDPEQLVKLIDEKKIPLRYMEIRKEDYLILNESKELKIALQRSLDFPSLYKDVIHLRKLE